MTDTPGRLMAGSAARLALGVALGLASTLGARAQGMGPGMMGGNGHGMMGGSGYGTTGAPAQASAATPAWGRLTAYVRAHQLTCLSCHALSQRSLGPPFVDIAHRFAGHPNGAAELARTIGTGSSGQWAGYPPMPGGLATPDQARILAQFILDMDRCIVATPQRGRRERRGSRSGAGSRAVAPRHHASVTCNRRGHSYMPKINRRRLSTSREVLPRDSDLHVTMEPCL